MTRYCDIQIMPIRHMWLGSRTSLKSKSANAMILAGLCLRIRIKIAKRNENWERHQNYQAAKACRSAPSGNTSGTRMMTFGLCLLLTLNAITHKKACNRIPPHEDLCAFPSTCLKRCTKNMTANGYMPPCAAREVDLNYTRPSFMSFLRIYHQI